MVTCEVIVPTVTQRWMVVDRSGEEDPLEAPGATARTGRVAGEVAVVSKAPLTALTTTAAGTTRATRMVVVDGTTGLWMHLVDAG